MYVALVNYGFVTLSIDYSHLILEHVRYTQGGNFVRLRYGTLDEDISRARTSFVLRYYPCRKCRWNQLGYGGGGADTLR